MLHVIDLHKAGKKDISKLQKKIITNKTGHRQTVYVKTNDNKSAKAHNVTWQDIEKIINEYRTLHQQITNQRTPYSAEDKLYLETSSNELTKHLAGMYHNNKNDFLQAHFYLFHDAADSQLFPLRNKITLALHQYFDYEDKQIVEFLQHDLYNDLQEYKININESLTSKELEYALIESWKDSSRAVLCQIAQKILAEHLNFESKLFFSDSVNESKFHLMYDFLQGTKFYAMMKDVVLNTYQITQKELKQLSATQINNIQDKRWHKIDKLIPEGKRELFYSFVDTVEKFDRGDAEVSDLTDILAQLKNNGIATKTFQKFFNRDSDQKWHSLPEVARFMYGLRNRTVIVKGDKVKLYRGVKKTYNIHSVLESWTTDINIAHSFNGSGVMEREIPIEAIYSFHQSKKWRQNKGGVGEKEAEYIVINGGKLKEN